MEDAPGFEDSYFVTCGPYIGVRESRRLVGQYVLTEQDIRQRRRFDDAIATGCWYMDRRRNRRGNGVETANRRRRTRRRQTARRTIGPGRWTIYRVG